ncbi:MAG: DUF2085 domain-containing protein [Candidatus Woesearchaeota archaeon]
MDNSLIFGELERGIKETSKYLLSHHKKEDYYKCYILKFKEHQVAICSRCLGIYVGIMIGAGLFYLQAFSKDVYYISIIIFPFFTLFDWSISAFTAYKGNNYFRTFFGILLGIAYAFGIIIFFKTFPNLIVISIGAFYIIITSLLILEISRRK